MRAPRGRVGIILVIAVGGSVAACGLGVAGSETPQVDAAADATFTPDAPTAIADRTVNDVNSAADSDSQDSANSKDAGADAIIDASTRDAFVDEELVDGCVPSPTGIIGWWAGDHGMLDRVNHNDGVSGTQNGATPVGYAPGEVAEAFDLTGGTNPYVQIKTAPAINLTGPITMEAWVYSNNFGGRIVDKQPAGGVMGYMLDTFNGYPRIIINGVDLSGPDKLATNVWLHTAGTWDGTTMRVYVNGAEVVNGGAATLSSTTMDLRIGADSNGQSNFDGLIDEVAIYDRALSQAEIQSIYNAGKSGRCK